MEPTEQLPLADRLLNKTQLRDALGLAKCSRLITAACWAGFPMPGGVSTVHKFHRWLDENPHFKKSDYDARGRRGAGGAGRGSTEGKSGG